MSIYKIIFICFIIKVIYNFLYWLYGFFLRYKWVNYFNNNDKNMIQYTYQIRHYLNKHSYCPSEIFKSNNQNEMFNSFLETQGYYRYALLQNFNPFYWINLIIFLPQNIIRYLGFKINRKSIKIINVIYWILTPILTIYNDEITTYIKETIKLLIEKLSK